MRLFAAFRHAAALLLTTQTMLARCASSSARPRRPIAASISDAPSSGRIWSRPMRRRRRFMALLGWEFGRQSRRAAVLIASTAGPVGGLVDVRDIRTPPPNGSTM
jgi:hypothetical protein